MILQSLILKTTAKNLEQELKLSSGIISHANMNFQVIQVFQLCLRAGMDINCGTYLLRYTASAVKQGKVQEEDIDRALFNLFSVQLRLGLFDGDPTKKQFGKLGPQDICTKEHRELALEAARQGIVLLKNDNRFLPLKEESVSSLAIIGPAANDTSKLGGGYSGFHLNRIAWFNHFVLSSI